MSDPEYTLETAIEAIAGPARWLADHYPAHLRAVAESLGFESMKAPAYIKMGLNARSLAKSRDSNWGSDWVDDGV
jgi:hypothetical protein